MAANRPAQLAERKQLVAQLTPSPAAAKQEQAHTDEVKAAERAVHEAHLDLERAQARVSHLWRQSHGRSHGQNTRDQDARSRLRASAHPAIAVVWETMIHASFNAMAVRASVVGLEEVIEEPAADAPESRQWWLRPAGRTTRLRPLTTHAIQTSLLEAIRAAYARVEDLAYNDIAADATLAALRVELDGLLRLELPTNFHHVRQPLALLRQKLDGDALTLWTIAEESA